MIAVALVGAGYWGKNLCRALAESPAVRLTWICDRSPTMLARASTIAPGAQTTQDFDRLTGDPSIDAIVIATPAGSHAGLALHALRSGKHVLVEKPLATSVVDAEEMCREAHERGLILMVGHTYLYNPAVQQVRGLIDGGELGNVQYAFLQRLNLGIVRSDVDALWNLAPHDIAMLAFWFDRPITHVAAVGHAYLQPGIVDVAFAHLTYEDGMSAHLHVSWLDPAKARRVTVVGSKRMLVFDDISADARLMVFDKGIDRGPTAQSMGDFASYAEHRFTVRAGDAWLPRVSTAEPLALEVAAFADSIDTGIPPIADGLHGAAVVRTLERVSSAIVATSRGVLGGG